MVHKKEEGTYHHMETLMKEMPGFLSPGRGLPLLLIPEYSGINKEQRIPDRSKTAHRKPPVKCFLFYYICKKVLDQMSLVSIKWKKVKVKVKSCPTLRPCELKPTRLLRPWDSSGKNTGVGCHLLLQGNFPTQGSNPGPLHCRQTLYHLSHQGSHNYIIT